MLWLPRGGFLWTTHLYVSHTPHYFFSTPFCRTQGFWQCTRDVRAEMPALPHGKESGQLWKYRTFGVSVSKAPPGPLPSLQLLRVSRGDAWVSGCPGGPPTPGGPSSVPLPGRAGPVFAASPGPPGSTFFTPTDPGPRSGRQDGVLSQNTTDRCPTAAQGSAVSTLPPHRKGLVEILSDDDETHRQAQPRTQLCVLGATVLGQDGREGCSEACHDSFTVLGQGLSFSSTSLFYSLSSFPISVSTSDSEVLVQVS